MRRRKHVAHLDDQILAVLRDHPGETARFVVVVLYRLPRHFLYSTQHREVRAHAQLLYDIDARIASLRRRGFVEAAGKSSRDRRQNTYQLTARAHRYAVHLDDLPPLEVRGRR